jgi:hypothetical protein
MDRGRACCAVPLRAVWLTASLPSQPSSYCGRVVVACLCMAVCLCVSMSGLLSRCCPLVFMEVPPPGAEGQHRSAVHHPTTRPTPCTARLPLHPGCSAGVLDGHPLCSNYACKAQVWALLALGGRLQCRILWFCCVWFGSLGRPQHLHRWRASGSYPSSVPCMGTDRRLTSLGRFCCTCTAVAGSWPLVAPCA